MSKKEKQRLLSQFSSMGDKELLDLYYNDFFACLGSDAEKMTEQGWDEADIRERRAYERFLDEKNNLEYQALKNRGIDPEQDLVGGK